MKQKWPQHICIVRHSQSTGNVARDADVPLAKLGARQAQALGDWFATLPPEQQATVVLYSPYMRARRTAQAVLARISADSLPCVVADERLREKEFGILDRWRRQAHPSRPSPTCRPRRDPERRVITA